MIQHRCRLQIGSRSSCMRAFYNPVSPNGCECASGILTAVLAHPQSPIKHLPLSHTTHSFVAHSPLHTVRHMRTLIPPSLCSSIAHMDTATSASPFFVPGLLILRRPVSRNFSRIFQKLAYSCSQVNYARSRKCRLTLIL